MKPARLLLLSLLLANPVFARPAELVLLVTADGLRWQEVFRGADQRLLQDERFTPKDYTRFASHQSAGPQAARRQLMPFLSDVVATRGVVIGDRDAGSRMRVTNPWWFSYPGYNEILTGRADPAIDSNARRPNPNITVLEWLNRQPGFRGRVLAFGSWDVFPDIINAHRSGIPVNAGFMAVTERASERELWLNELQAQASSPWPTVRLDVFTHQYALETLRHDRPRVIYIAYGETDDYAHEGKYPQYLDAAYRFDGFVRDLWENVQRTSGLKDRTVLLITTDHGRGEVPLEAWQHHSSAAAVRGYSGSLATEYPEGITGSDHIWFAAIGSGVAARGSLGGDVEFTQSQIAATLLQALDIDRESFDAAAGPALEEIFIEPSQP